jgi:hypothetical protein
MPYPNHPLGTAIVPSQAKWSPIGLWSSRSFSMVAIGITPTANRELEELLQNLATIGSFDTSDRFLKRLNQKFTKISAFPNLEKARPEWLYLLESP